MDEVGELPGETQIALLRVLQEHEFERVGGMLLIRADVRVVAATNRDLEAASSAALAETRGRVSGPSGAAAKLRIPRSTLEDRIKALKINKQQLKFS